MPYPPVDDVRAAHQAGESWASQAQERIAALETENARLRTALEFAAGCSPTLYRNGNGYYECGGCRHLIRNAHDTLEGKQP